MLHTLARVSIMLLVIYICRPTIGLALTHLSWSCSMLSGHKGVICTELTTSRSGDRQTILFQGNMTKILKYKYILV